MAIVTPATIEAQPIIRGIQAVGSVNIIYSYNGGNLTLPTGWVFGSKKAGDTIPAGKLDIAGFRLDGEFVRAVQQISSSVVIPILGGGGVALTNNNRTGTLTFTCAKVSTPDVTSDATNPGQMFTPGGSGIGVVDNKPVYDMVFIAQLQQAQSGGDSIGSTLNVKFNFCGLQTNIVFEGCTVATVDPIALSGNDAASYQVVWNYLNWYPVYGDYTNKTGQTAIASTPGDSSSGS